MFTVKQLRAGVARRFRDAAMHTPRALALSIVAGAAVLASGLGVAAPAEALQAPPVGPPVLNLPSSVIGAATGNDPNSGAQLGGQIANGTKGSPAFPAGSLSKTVGSVSQVISGYNLGTFVGGIVDQAFGIDRDGTVCSATGTDFGGTVLRTLSGADCSAYDIPSTYTPNTDAPSTVNGSLMSFTSSDGKVYTMKVTGMSPAPTQWSQTRRAWCYQSTATGISGTLASWSQATWKDPSNGVTYGVTWGMVDPSGNVMMPRSSGANTPGGASWVGTCADGTKITSGTGIMDMPVENPLPAGYVPVRNYGGTYQKLPGVATSGSITMASTDPTRWLTCTIRTTDGQSYVGTSSNFTEGSGTMAPLKCPTIPATATAGHMTITLNGGPQVLTLYDQDSTAAYQAAQSAYPACANGTCQLDLIDGTGSCYSGDSERCATWVSDPNRDTKYKCKYGSYDVPLKECFALGNAFDLAKVAAGNAIADPATGNDTKGQTSTKPSTGTGGSADPATGDERPDCWPSGWAAFNPLNWVLQPIQCAFTPRKSELDKVAARVNTAWRATAVAKVGDTMTTWAGQLPNVSGCSGPHIAWDWAINIPDAWGGPRHLTYDGYPLSACDDPAKTLAATGRVIGALVLYFFATLAIVRNLSGIVNQKGIGEGNSA